MNLGDSLKRMSVEEKLKAKIVSDALKNKWQGTRDGQEVGCLASSDPPHGLILTHTESNPKISREIPLARSVCRRDGAALMTG